MFLNLTGGDIVKGSDGVLERVVIEVIYSFESSVAIAVTEAS